MPSIGDTAVLKAESGLGQTAADGDLKSEMADLDMAPGTQVTVDAVDPDAGLVFVAWEDASGNPRRTSVELSAFSDQFQPEGA